MFEESEAGIAAITVAITVVAVAGEMREGLEM